MNFMPNLPSIQNLTYAAAGFAAGISPAVYQKLKKKPPEAPDQKIKDLFKKLLISDWHLPGLSSSILTLPDAKAPEPIFNRKINDEIAVISQLMERSRENNGKPPLPNLLFIGEPGVGKSMLLRELCMQSGTGFISLPSGVMESHLKNGSHITTLHSIYEVASLCSMPVLCTMDDGEQLISQRPETNAVTPKDTSKAEWIIDQEKMSETIAQRRIALVNSILEEAGKAQRKISFAVTTNRPYVIDKAFLTRVNSITFPLPMEDERKKIIVTHLPSTFNYDKNILSFFNSRILDDMAKKTEGFTGRNIVIMLNDLYACVMLEEGNIRDELVDASIIAMHTSIRPANGTFLMQSDQYDYSEEDEEDEDSDKFGIIKEKFWQMTNKVQMTAKNLKNSLFHSKNKSQASNLA